VKEMEEFIIEASGMVPESEAARLKTQIVRLEEQLELLRQDKELLKVEAIEAQGREMEVRGELAVLSVQMQQMVQRDLWEQAALEASRYKGEVDSLRLEMGAMEKQLKTLRAMLAEMVPSVEVEEARSAQEKAESEMRKLTRLLSQAGLSDTTVLTNFVQSVVGPPQQDIAELTGFLLFICDKQYSLQQLAQFCSQIADMSLSFEHVDQLLQTLKGPPVRSVHDVCTIIHVLNGGQGELAWQGSEVMKLLHVMRKHPTLSVEELSEILELCESLEELQRLFDSICPYPEAHAPDQRGKGGIGLLLEKVSKREGGGHFIREVVDGGPAAMDARIRVGDQVMFIDGEDVAEMPLHLVTALLRGQPGSMVEVVMIQADYRKDRRVHPNALPAIAWYTVALERQENPYYDREFAKQILQRNPSPVPVEETVNLWDSLSMGVEDISNVVWPASAEPEAVSGVQSTGLLLDTSLASNAPISHAENFLDFRRSPRKIVPTESYISAPGCYRTTSVDCDLIAM
jgi:hypothetical protein